MVEHTHPREGERMSELGATLRVWRPLPYLYAFYDGRIEGVRAWSAEPNWLDDGAFTLGIASYAIVDGEHALLYDTHISTAHAQIIRQTLEAAGVKHIRVALSHWHNDHIAGNAVFSDCEIIAHQRTAHALTQHREALERSDPAIKPLTMPTCQYDGILRLHVGKIAVELHTLEIHSHDGTVLFIPEDGTLLAGDTLEDPVTFLDPDEVARLPTHVANLQRLLTWPITRIYPSHGLPDLIATSGHDKRLIDATLGYTRKLMACQHDASLVDTDLRRFAEEWFAAGAIHYYAAYEPVHYNNLVALGCVPDTAPAASPE
ncbi:MAG: MBL fold metallo-hydrolase [Burkholderiales bacterium]|nr:MBL fold metallo-hydrolase [Burkholderiales bacterium]